MEDFSQNVSEETGMLLSKIQRLKLLGFLGKSDPKSQSDHYKEKVVSNYLKVEEAMKKDALRDLRGSKWKQPEQPSRKIFAHKKIEVSTFDTMKEIIHKNRSNLEYLKTYSRNLKESLRSNVAHTSVHRNNSIKKSVFVKEPEQNIMEGYLNIELQDLEGTLNRPKQSYQKSYSVVLNNMGRMVNATTKETRRPSTQAKVERNTHDTHHSRYTKHTQHTQPPDDKSEKVRQAVQEIKQKESDLYKQIHKSLYSNANSAISLKSNVARANILYSNRWHKMFSKTVSKYNLEQDSFRVEEGLNGVEEQESRLRKGLKSVYQSGHLNGQKRSQSSNYSIQQNKEYLRKTPIFNYSKGG